jgi:hypothetical protein
MIETYMHLNVKVHSDEPRRVTEPERRSRVTLAILGEGNEYQVGISWCSPKDQFRRKAGRLRAKARVTNPNHSFKMTFMPDPTAKTLYYGLKAQVVAAFKAYCKEHLNKLPWWCAYPVTVV